jgi:hypothetical protein
MRHETVPGERARPGRSSDRARPGGRCAGASPAASRSATSAARAARRARATGKIERTFSRVSPTSICPRVAQTDADRSGGNRDPGCGEEMVREPIGTVGHDGVGATAGICGDAAADPGGLADGAPSGRAPR